MQPKVSICCVTYNHADFIKLALDGFLMQQTNFEFEIIIHDDASIDGTAEIIKEYQEKYPEILIPYFQIENQWSKGVRGIFARFTFPHARGKYIALCEGDDYWTDPLKLQKQVDFLEGNEEYSLVFTNGLVNYENSRQNMALIYDNQISESADYKSFKIPQETTDIGFLANGNYIHTAGVVFKNWLLNNEIPQFLFEVSIGDWPLHMKTATFGKIKYLNCNTFCYRVHRGGLYSKKSNIGKYKMTLGQFPPMLNFNYFEALIQKQIENYCLKSSKAFFQFVTKEEDVLFFKDYINSFNNRHFLLKIELTKILEINLNKTTKKNIFNRFLLATIKQIKQILKL